MGCRPLGLGFWERRNRWLVPTGYFDFVYYRFRLSLRDIVSSANGGAGAHDDTYSAEGLADQTRKGNQSSVCVACSLLVFGSG